MILTVSLFCTSHLYIVLTLAVSHTCMHPRVGENLGHMTSVQLEIRDIVHIKCTYVSRIRSYK